MTAITAGVVGLVIAIRVLAARRPLAGIGGSGVLAAALLAAFTAWAFVSAAWSDAPVRALVEFDRALLYLLMLLLFASLPRTADSARWLVRGIALGAAIVCACALITRTLPELWPTEPAVANDRLSYPLTYWNALGMLATIGLVLGFGLTSDLRERAAVRVLAAGALPVLAATLVFTFSRAAMLLAVVGLVVLVALIRSRGILSGALVLPFVAMSVAAALGADQLASERPTSGRAVGQGQEVITVVVLAVVAALLARWTLLRFDARAAATRADAWRIPRRLVAATAAIAIASVAVGLAAGGADALSRQYDRFVEGNRVEAAQDRRERLFDPGNNGRVSQWRVAADAFAGDRLKGTGAGTYAVVWARDRPSEFRVEDAHSLYLETLAEQGLVGGVLLMAVVAMLLAALLRRARGQDRAVWAALFTAALAWALHAGVDWDWEMPAVTLWVFAAGGLALAARPERSLPWRVPVAVRLAVVIAIVALLVTPGRVVLAEQAAGEGRAAFARGDCETAISESRTAIGRLDVAPEPHEIIGYCLVRLGEPASAVASMRAAIERDPQNWRPRYGLSIALGAAGRDPRAAIREARAYNPLEGLMIATSMSFHATVDPRSWRKRALGARLPKD